MITRTLLVLCIAVSYIIGADEDYDGFVRALKVFKQAFDFSTEEPKISHFILLENELQFKFANLSYVMGLRGRDIWGKWYPDVECMAVMITPYTALTPCQCIWSWYRSFLGKPLGTGNFTVDPFSPKNDIKTAELFLYHTLHPPLSPVDDYFREELTRYYAILNDPLDSFECKAAIPNHRLNQETSVALVELQTPVFEGDNVPVGIPYVWINEDYRPKAKSSPLRLLVYNAQFVEENHIYVPNYALPEYRKRREIWRAWSNFGRLRDELISIEIEPVEDCRDLYNWDSGSAGQLECWRAVSAAKQLCNFIVGGVIVTPDNEFYGMTMNRVMCPEIAEKILLEVRRINEINGVPTIQLLTAEHSDRVIRRNKIAAEHDRSLRLFHGGLGEIAYDEDFDPSLLFKVTRDIHVGRSRGPHKRALASIVLTAATHVFWFHQ
ncbi:hypothetical protein GE061_005666 [Apolygus lucorum]|uniref:Uncharacterized protein n=1 Tax=Apolygus lucorum TaxID=248454 RepID=A0A8S9WYB2_APOLU|nr:hypothetical protein GE061_005666 [Apolygus lucorum]